MSAGLEVLESFCLLAKSAKGAAAAQLITQVLEHPEIFVFGELIDCANIRAVSAARPFPGERRGDLRTLVAVRCHSATLVLAQLEGTSAAPSLELLRLFAYGTWLDYKGERGRREHADAARGHSPQ